MSFKQDWDVAEIYRQLRSIASQIRSPYNDGFTSSCCKQDLYRVKCFIEDLYADLPKFSDESKWEQERMIELLKRKESSKKQ